jgi:metallo-beta-lactamase family protein
LAKNYGNQRLSAGDQEDLLNWLSALKNKPSKVFLVHGETSPQMNCE